MCGSVHGERWVRVITSRWRVGRMAVREVGETGSRREGGTCGCEGQLEGRRWMQVIISMDGGRDMRLWRTVGGHS